MSNRRCPRVRPSRLAREHEWLADRSFSFTRFVRIGEHSQKQDATTPRSSAYPTGKDAENGEGR